MKKILVLLLVIVAISAQAQTAKVYFIRPYNYTGSMIGYKVFIDSTVVCKLNNVKHSIHDVPAGEHEFYARLYSKNSSNDEKINKIKLTLEPGKTYYIQILLTPTLLLQTIDNETNAMAILKTTKLDKKCE